MAPFRHNSPGRAEEARRLVEAFNAASVGFDTEAYGSALDWYLGASRRGRSVSQNSIVEIYDLGPGRF